MFKPQTANYPYTLTDKGDRTTSATISKTDEPLMDSIRHLVSKQNRLLQYERAANSRIVASMGEEIGVLKRTLRGVGGGGEDEELVVDDIVALTQSDLVNLDKSGVSMARGGLKDLVLQLTDLSDVRSINLSSNFLNDDCCEDLAQLVTLDRPLLPPHTVAPVGFVGIDLSFNDLGPRAFEKVFKFGVLHNHLTWLDVSANVLAAAEATMGSSIADWVKGGATPGGVGNNARGTKKTGDSAAIVARAAAGKLVSLRVTLFDYHNTIVDQNPVVVAASGKRGKRAAPVARKGKKGASVVSGAGPMNALGFVKGLLGVAEGVVRKGAKKAPVRSTKKADSGDKNVVVILRSLFEMITDESEEDFEANIPPMMEGAVLDTPLPAAEDPKATRKPSSKSKRPMAVAAATRNPNKQRDTLLCHAVRHGKVGCVEALLARGASPTAGNGGEMKTTPLQLAKFTGRTSINDMLRAAVREGGRGGESSELLGGGGGEAAKKACIQSLGLVHAKLHKDTIRHLANNMYGLTSLDISGGFVGADGARMLADNLVGKPTMLLSLNLSSNSIGCTGAQLMANMLAMNDTLTLLDVSSNDIGDEGSRSLGKGLRENSTLACICVGDNPISGEGVRKLLKVARECENLISLKGSDQLLAPVKLRTMVENNDEGREGGGAGEMGDGDESGSDGEDEEEREELKEVSRQGGGVIAAQGGGGEWACMKCGVVSFSGDVVVSCLVKLGKVNVGGVKKPVTGYTLCLARKRFGLGWQKIGAGECVGGEGYGSWRDFEWDLAGSLAGDELGLWVKVLPVGGGEVGGICRDWKVGGAGGGEGKVSLRDGGGGRAVWN